MLIPMEDIFMGKKFRDEHPSNALANDVNISRIEFSMWTNYGHVKEDVPQL